MNLIKTVVFSGVLLTSFASADDWISPTENQYRAANPELFKDYLVASELLDNYGGDQSTLEAAANILGPILGKDPDFAPAYVEFGKLHIELAYESGQSYDNKGLHKAWQFLDKALALKPDYEDAYIQLGSLYIASKQYDVAYEMLERAEQLGSKSDWIPADKAEIHYRKKDYATALSLFTQVANNPSVHPHVYTRALSRLPRIHSRMGQLEEAKTAYKNLLVHRPEHAWSWGNYASFMLYTYGDFDEAIVSAVKARELMDYGQARQTLAIALYSKWAQLAAQPDNHSQAEAYFREAEKIVPDHNGVIKTASKYKKTKPTAQAIANRLDYEKSY